MNPTKIMCFLQILFYLHFYLNNNKMCLFKSEIQVQTPFVSFNGISEHNQPLSTRSSALCCSQDMGSLLDLSFAAMDDNKKIQETRNLRPKIQIHIRKPQGDKEDEERS